MRKALVDELRSDREAAIEKRLTYLSGYADELSPFVSSAILAKLRARAAITGKASTGVTINCQPEAIVHGDLRDYQLLGLQFLARMFDRGANAILGGESVPLCTQGQRDGKFHSVQLSVANFL